MNEGKDQFDHAAHEWPPELRIAVVGFLAAFLWEMWQMPFYDTRGVSLMSAVKGCSLGSLGDAGILTGAYAIVGRLTRERDWYRAPTLRQILVFLSAGLVATVSIEQLAIRSNFGWNYSARMPVEPVLGTGLVPIIMWVVIPLLVLWLMRRLSWR